jgi:ADP-heptose:LPS heptosyltransferase
MKVSEIKFDCVFFRGDIPCAPNKEHFVACDNCTFYRKASKRILIIKLGAIGDVIRTTPLLSRYRQEYPNCHITWITHTPDILPKEEIDSIYKFDFRSCYILQNREFDIAVNLDKDVEACILLKDIHASEKYGFLWKDKHIAPATKAAEHKLITGFFDHISIKNTKNYLEEIFEICHFDFKKEPYLIHINEAYVQKWRILKTRAGSKKIIGLNTGCGKRWLTRLWPEEYWLDLIRKLKKKGFYPLIMGGPEEHEQNLKYAKLSGAYYPGVFSLPEFIGISANTDLVLSAVSMMMHIAIALKKPLILFNNIFNKHEFELYGRGAIIEPPEGCDCYYGQSCKREKHCMKSISVEMVLRAIEKHV